MMSISSKTATALLALTAIGCGAFDGASALASAGGSQAPSESPLPPPVKIRASAIATWFGPGFYGKRTACGQTLTPSVVGVANRKLPCGTLVKVTYARHTLTVPVLDRGPYSSFGADWDLTAGAAQALGITETVRIRARVVGSAPNSPVLGAPAAGAAGSPLAGGVIAG
jgi:rare lipoprotein A